MNLPNPIPSVDPGPDYANNLQSSLNLVDQHNHTPGEGVQIPSAGLNINAALTFANNPATNLQASVFYQQASLSTLNALFVGTDGNLYFNDGVGDPSIKITSGGSVNATSSGISSGTNSASFVSNVLVVNAAANTPANIQGASLLLGNNSVGTKYLTLSPPASMPANFTLVLPSIPGATSFLQIDTSGNITAGPGISGGITTSNISPSAGITGSQLSASAGIAGSQLANGTVTTTQLANGAVTYPILGAAAFASSGSFSGSTASTTPQAQSGSAVTITGQGRPVVITLAPIGTGGTVQSSMYNSSTSDWIRIDLYRAGSFFSRTSQQGTGGALIGNPTAITWFDNNATSGSVTYEIYISSGNGGGTSVIDDAQLVAYSL
jgi:hypothetical protein